MIVLDTSVVVNIFTGPRRSAAALRNAVEDGERFLLSTIVLYEWLRGPRLPSELAAQEAVFPIGSFVPFGPSEAMLAARLYRALLHPRGRAIDVAIAAFAIAHDAPLWTLNTRDFRDIPALRLYLPV